MSLVEDLLGGPVEVEVLKDKPGRRQTARARGPRGTAIVKQYVSDRAPIVAARLQALADGPPEPVVPAVLGCDPTAHVVVLTDVPGTPLSHDLAAVGRVGQALGTWHAWWAGQRPGPLEDHTPARELAIIDTWLARTDGRPAEAAATVRHRLSDITWAPATVVHRDLYEEQILLGPAVGLIDLDDVALGPPELDLGNLLAHLHLLGRRRQVDVRSAAATLLAAYRTAGLTLDDDLLSALRLLSLARLACIHSDAGLLDGCR
ncbi:MAG: aminoglycoside phosphotransferase family protein [Acidimicrobiales bacterium]